MNDWNEGYFTDSTYTYGYYSELNPVAQRFCLLINGVLTTPPFGEQENHCELGYGQGVSINIHAAANPGKYFGTDFNPAHAEHANILCQESGSGAKLFDDSFEEFLKRDDLPQFDSISLHGIWSWISAENQRHIVEFVRKFLKPGGILYNSYNCYPGWSPAAPLRELFVLYDKYAHQSSKTFNRVEEAIKFTEKIISNPQNYFARVPDVKQIFERTRKLNHNYLAHEYFNRDWICMYFNEVAEMFQEAKMDFACTASLLEQRDEFILPKHCIDFLNTLENPIMREQVRDYFLNRQFRKDLSIRGGVKISQFNRIKKVLETRYVLADRNPLPTKIKLPSGTLDLPPVIVEKFFEYLSAEDFRPKDLKEFAKKNPALSARDIESLLIAMIHAGKIFPCQSEDAVAKVQSKCHALNKYICEQAKYADDIQFLASPLTGGGIALNRLERIFTAAIFDGKNTIDEIANYAWEIFRSQGQGLVVQGKVLQTAEENIAEFKNAVKTFMENRLPVLKTLQVIQ